MNHYLVSNEYPWPAARSRDHVEVMAADMPAARRGAVVAFRATEWARADRQHRLPDPECWDIAYMDVRCLCHDSRLPWSGAVVAADETE